MQRTILNTAIVCSVHFSNSKNLHCGILWYWYNLSSYFSNSLNKVQYSPSTFLFFNIGCTQIVSRFFALFAAASSSSKSKARRTNSSSLSDSLISTAKRELPDCCRNSVDACIILRAGDGPRHCRYVPVRAV